MKKALITLLIRKALISTISIITAASVLIVVIVCRVHLWLGKVLKWLRFL